MEMSSADAPRASSSKARAKSTSPAATPKPTIKVRAARKPLTETPDAMLEPTMATAAPAGVADMIATTAYFLAAERDFTPGRELDDWLEAERRVHALLNG